MEIKRQDIFPTAFWSWELGLDQRQTDQLLTILDRERKLHSQGEQRSSVLGWQSRRTINQLYNISFFTDKILEAGNYIAEFLHWDMENLKLEISNCWFNVNGKFAQNRIHHHSNSLLSGVYYLLVPEPENSGNLFFIDPRSSAQQFIPPYKERTIWTASSIVAPLKTGTLLLFPSWLQHGVSTNLSEYERISISFNLVVARK
jgi:uncharacterized protein (TIGR02466 family)